MSDDNNFNPKPGSPEMLAKFIYECIGAHAAKNTTSTLEILGALELVKINIMNTQIN